MLTVTVREGMLPGCLYVACPELEVYHVSDKMDRQVQVEFWSMLETRARGIVRLAASPETANLSVVKKFFPAAQALLAHSRKARKALLEGKEVILG